MKRKVLIPIDEDWQKYTAEEIIADAFGNGLPFQGPTKATQMTQFTFYWERSETVLEVVNKISFVDSLDEAENCADYIRRFAGLPLKPLPRERGY